MAALRPDAGGTVTEKDEVYRQPQPMDVPTYDRSSELKSFMYAVFRSGGSTFGGDGGGYGFPKDQWDEMAAAAGIRGANIGDPQAQTYVAAYWMDSLYKKYKNWGLVAVAWKNGGGAVAEIVKQVRKEPSQITMADIQSVAPDAAGWAEEVTNWQVRAEQKGGIPDALTQEQPSPSAHTTTVGTGNVNLDVYADTAEQLRQEWLAEDAARQPSGAEMLFAQLEGLSAVVSGGEGRKNWQHDAPESVSGGSVQSLETMDRPGQETT